MTIFERFATTAGNFPDHPFIHIPRQATLGYADGSLGFTYREALGEVTALARIYDAQGYGPAHRVGLALDNRADFFLHFLALNALGACVVPINGEATGPELQDLCGRAELSVVVALREHLPVLTGAGVPVVEVTALEELPAVERTQGDADARGARAPAAIVFTSGTTGKPKGCVLSNEYFIYAGEWYRGLGGCCQLHVGEERLITPLPLFHINALAFSSMAMIETGGCIIQLDRFHPTSWWQTVRESRATAVHYLGVMPAILLAEEAGEGDDFRGQIKYGFGAGVEPAHHGEFERRFGFKLIEGWAMTETGASACIMDTHEPRQVGRRCLGRPPRHMEYRILDEDGKDVDGRQPGELLVRRRGADPRRYFFSAYFRDGLATEAAWQDGWFHTGDVVYADGEGRLYFVERKKNIIRRSGENIAAAEVEGVLLRHSTVAHCAVAPVADELRGEEVAACIVPVAGAPGTEATAQGLVRHCLEHLSYFKVPGYILFADALPTTSTQKVQRAELRAYCEGRLGQPGCVDVRAMKKRGGGAGSVGAAAGA